MTSATPKRSLFSKPSWATSTAAPAAATDDDATFGRHNQIYDDIIAEKLKRKQKQTAKARAREISGGREPKRRRISDDHEDGSNSDAASSEPEENETLSRKAETAGSATRSTPTRRKFTAAWNSPVKPVVSKPKPAAAAPIALDDDDDLQIMATTTATMATKKLWPQKSVVDDLESDPESDDDDDYIRDLKRRTKGTAPASKRADITRRSPTDPSTSMTESLELPQGSPSVAEEDPQKDEGPLVKILITSIYPNTKPLLVGQPASRSLKKAKEVWCQRQGFDELKTKSFFLTFNGTKLFDSSNLLNTLEVLKRQRPHEDNPSDGKIHLEAMNPEIMEHRKKQKEREEAEAAGPAEQDGRNEAAPEESAPPPEKKFVITLQGENMEPFRLNVRPSTLIYKIMTGFHNHMGIEEGKVCWLVFDGNRLEPNTTIQDAEVEEDDVVEVHIR